MKVINCNNILELNGWSNGNNVLLFVEDADGNKIVGLQILEDKAFAEIHDILNEQPKIDYNPKETEL